MNVLLISYTLRGFDTKVSYALNTKVPYVFKVSFVYFNHSWCKVVIDLLNTCMYGWGILPTSQTRGAPNCSVMFANIGTSDQPEHQDAATIDAPIDDC